MRSPGRLCHDRVTSVAPASSLAVTGAIAAVAPPAAAGITNSWNASVSQSGPSVNAGNVSYDAAVPQGGSVQWGFRATWSGSDVDPSAFWFNGASCAIG